MDRITSPVAAQLARASLRLQNLGIEAATWLERPALVPPLASSTSTPHDGLFASPAAALAAGSDASPFPVPLAPRLSLRAASRPAATPLATPAGGSGLSRSRSTGLVHHTATHPAPLLPASDAHPLMRGASAPTDDSIPKPLSFAAFSLGLLSVDTHTSAAAAASDLATLTSPPVRAGARRAAPGAPGAGTAAATSGATSGSITARSRAASDSLVASIRGVHVVDAAAVTPSVAARLATPRGMVPSVSTRASGAALAAVPPASLRGSDDARLTAGARAVGAQSVAAHSSVEEVAARAPEVAAEHVSVSILPTPASLASSQGLSIRSAPTVSVGAGTGLFAAAETADNATPAAARARTNTDSQIMRLPSAAHETLSGGGVMDALPSPRADLFVAGLAPFCARSGDGGSGAAAAATTAGMDSSSSSSSSIAAPRTSSLQVPLSGRQHKKPTSLRDWFQPSEEAQRRRRATELLRALDERRFAVPTTALGSWAVRLQASQLPAHHNPLSCTHSVPPSTSAASMATLGMMLSPGQTASVTSPLQGDTIAEEMSAPVSPPPTDALASGPDDQLVHALRTHSAGARVNDAKAGRGVASATKKRSGANMLSPGKGVIRRAVSLTELTEKQQLSAERQRYLVEVRKLELAAAKELEQQLHRISRMSAFLVFEVTLILGYTLYRTVACPKLEWQCINKSYQRHFDDIVQLLTIGGVLFATGPTIQKPLYLPSVIVFACSLLAFGAFGEIPFMFNSLNSNDSWQPPALYLYLCAAGLLVGILVYSFIVAQSRYEWILSGTTFLGIVVVYTVASVIPAAAFHPHHYMIAWNIALFLRNPHDPPSLLLRWLLLGIFVHGIAAYSASSILEN